MPLFSAAAKPRPATAAHVTRLERMGIGYDLLHGGVPVAHRPALLDRFRKELHKRVLLSTDVGGVGLDLQVASYVIHLDLPWNPGRLDQRTARAHRLGADPRRLGHLSVRRARHRT